MIPIYGFLEGDTMGLLLLGREDETVAALAERMQLSASVRVARKGRVRVMYRGRALDDAMTLARAELAPLDRLDVVDAGAAEPEGTRP